MMTQECETVDDFSTATPIEFVTGTGSTVTSSSSSRGSSLHFQIAVVVIGVLGTAANGLIVYAMVASKQHKKHVLIFNQNVLDLTGCFFLFTRFSARLANIYLTATPGQEEVKTTRQTKTTTRGSGRPGQGSSAEPLL